MGSFIRDNSNSVDNTPGTASKAMFYYFQCGGYLECDKGYFTDRENFNSILLILTLRGQGYLEYRGRSYSVSEGQMLLIDCNEHQYYSVGECEEWVFKFIHFNGCESKQYFEKIIENSGPILSQQPNSIVELNIDKILSLFQRRDKRAEILSSCLVLEMLTELLISSYNYNNESNIPYYIEKAIAIIEKDYNKKLNLDDIANEININKFYLTKQFKKCTHQSLYEYILNFRLNASKKLLKSGQLPVCEIAEQIGFEETSHYIKMFKKNEGTTPLKFRKYWM